MLKPAAGPCRACKGTRTVTLKQTDKDGKEHTIIRPCPECSKAGYLTK
jgi:hypothetical protein